MADKQDAYRQHVYRILYEELETNDQEMAQHHQEHPHVYEVLRDMSLLLANHGVKIIRLRLLLNLWSWIVGAGINTEIMTSLVKYIENLPEEKREKWCRDNFTAGYSRLLVALEPTLEGVVTLSPRKGDEVAIYLAQQEGGGNEKDAFLAHWAIRMGISIDRLRQIIDRYYSNEWRQILESLAFSSEENRKLMGDCFSAYELFVTRESVATSQGPSQHSLFDF